MKSFVMVVVQLNPLLVRLYPPPPLIDERAREAELWEKKNQTAYENQIITTRSNPTAFPSALRQKKTSLVQHKAVEKKKVYVRSFSLPYNTLFSSFLSYSRFGAVELN